jgi:hypothetical protein
MEECTPNPNQTLSNFDETIDNFEHLDSYDIHDRSPLIRATVGILITTIVTKGSLEQ